MTTLKIVTRAYRQREKVVRPVFDLGVELTCPFDGLPLHLYKKKVVYAFCKNRHLLTSPVSEKPEATVKLLQERYPHLRQEATLGQVSVSRTEPEGEPVGGPPTPRGPGSQSSGTPAGNGAPEDPWREFE